MDELEFKRLIEGYQHGLLSGKEKKLVDEWFEAMGQDNVQQLWSAEDNLNLKKKILAQIAADEKSIFIRKGLQKSISSGKGFRVRPLLYRIAASILFLATLSYFGWQWRGGLFKLISSGAEVTSVNSTPGSISKVLLSDGSLVWLKGNSTLTYPEEFSGAERQVALQGEALFEVEKDPAHPFIIQCGELTTTVLGTSFNIKTSEENIEVVVLTGRVALTSATDKQGIVVLPDEKAVYNGLKKQLSKVETVMEEPVVIVSGTEYDMNFNDTRMTEIIRRIEGKFNVKVTMSDSKLGNCMITANFTDQSLDRTFNMISQALGFEYEIDGNEISLRGTGCDQ